MSVEIPYHVALAAAVAGTAFGVGALVGVVVVLVRMAVERRG